MNKLVIVESPNKIKTIKKYLGEDYEVLASVGHVVKLKTSGPYGFGIDMENWEPLYTIDPEKKDVMKQLSKAVKNASEVYIATDPDREGEAIGANLVDLLEIKDKYQRIKYNEITEEAILNAMKHPSKIDESLVNAQKSRRMLDRVIGFRLSKLLAMKISNPPKTPSAGRVQSIALKLIIDRENEIKAFVPIQYFTIDALIKKNLKASYFNKDSSMASDWIEPSLVDEIYNSLKGDLKVIDIKRSKRTETKVTPFKQSVLFKRSGLSAAVVQSSLQRLYEGFGDGGLITYPRTDSTRMSETFVQQAKKYIAARFGQEYVSSTIKGFSGDQDAHEAIRITNCDLSPAMAKEKYNLQSSDYKVYEMVYYNSLQAIMEPPVKNVLRYEFENNGHKFKLSGSTVEFDGYYKLTGYEKENELPNYEIGEMVNIKEYIKEEHHTNPPARYNDGSLIEMMDEIKVGRPSTFASTVKIIKDRLYVTTEGKALVPTEFGYLVLNKLLEATPEIINETYTAQVESELDEIAADKINYKNIMNSFWNKFNTSLNDSFETLEKTSIIPESVGEDCPEEGSPLIYRHNKKTGQRFIGCSAFPKCKFMKPDPDSKPKFKRFFPKKEESVN